MTKDQASTIVREALSRASEGMTLDELREECEYQIDRMEEDGE